MTSTAPALAKAPNVALRSTQICSSPPHASVAISVAFSLHAGPALGTKDNAGEGKTCSCPPGAYRVPRPDIYLRPSPAWRQMEDTAACSQPEPYESISKTLGERGYHAHVQMIKLRQRQASTGLKPHT